MLPHDFIEMPSKATAIGDNPFETTMLLRCKACLKTPAKAREDGCPVRELTDVGQICLSEWNPAGIGYFNGRTCVTCERPIMEHWLRKGSQEYWCHENQNQFSYGVNGCVNDVSALSSPVEQTGSMGAV